MKYVSCMLHTEWNEWMGVCWNVSGSIAGISKKHMCIYIHIQFKYIYICTYLLFTVQLFLILKQVLLGVFYSRISLPQAVFPLNSECRSLGSEKQR